MELRVWIGAVQRIISGVSLNTTSQDVILALAQATGKTGRFTLIEKWRDYEKPLSPTDCPLTLAQSFGDYAHEVQFILRQTGEASTPNRRLAEAKSPKPQRRRAAIKKSMSFSGGAQSTSPSPKVTPLVSAITEEDCSSDPSYVTPQPRKTVPRPHPPDQIAQSMRDVENGSGERSTDSASPPDLSEKKTRHSSGQSASRSDRSKRRKSAERLSDKKESRSRSDRHQEREAELRLRETLELRQTIANHERRLDEENRKLHNVDKDIASVTVEEEHKWGELYDCRDEISKSLPVLQHLEVELDDFDEVLLSEELNVLLRKQQEMNEEMLDLQQQIAQCDSHLNAEREQSNSLNQQLQDTNLENQKLDSTLKENKEEMSKLQSRVEEKKRFLLEAEDGYMSACDDLKEAGNSLDKRRQMLVELERELREYNLKTFISTGFSEKLTNEAGVGT